MRKPIWALVVVWAAVPLLAGDPAAVAQRSKIDDLVQRPTLYDSFYPPELGASYVDPTFKTVVRRLSNAPDMPNIADTGPLSWVSTEFSTASPWSALNRWLILQHQSYFGLYRGRGRYVKDLPLVVNASSEPRWSRTDPNVLYFVSANQLMKLNVRSGEWSLVRSFAEYAAIRGRGESDISHDGDHFVFAADPPWGEVAPNRYVFVYEISTDTKGPVLDTLGHPFDGLYITPNNEVLITWLANGTTRHTGVELFDRSMNFRRQLTHAIGHMHLARDTNGDEVLVWTNSGDPWPLEGCPNGIVKVRLADAQQSCLLRLDWSLAVHITAPDAQGWVLAETYAPSDPSAAGPGWVPYTNEILQIRLDGTQTRRLLHHRSRPVNSYNYQPRVSVSRDGTQFVFTSNFGLHALLGYPTVEYSDVYLVRVKRRFLK
jgi:hypothetical protein